ncbi:MAG: 16S rRNA (guanine(527)-N(7))-methyltransferase RsmG [Candidatus Eremiobacteraeota bacterium]|nr:16S rRNA (guanine(527)-N(7))-methyltransferase RsmG [Candidatus Eremiobacteraeota bacterium]
MTESADIQRHLEDAGLEATYLARLAAYGGMLLEANRRLNLTGAKSAEELVPHLVDSLSVVPYIHGRYIDVGSGGGFPAIPVAIATGVEVTMVESIAKKAVFLRAALDELGLPGRVIPERAEICAHDPELRGQFQAGTGRAVSSAPTVAELLLPFLKIGGVAILQRGILEDRERNALADASPMLGGRLAGEHVLDGGRRIVILEKTGETPGRFPRRAGVPEKRPLCL